MGTLLIRPPGHRRDVALRPAAEDLGRRIVNQIVQFWP